MKNLIFFLLFFPLIGYSQIGIGTETPTRTLDINGDLRIRNTPATTRESAAKDSILVVDLQGNVDRTTSQQVIYSHFKSFVRGNFGTSGNTNIPASGTGLIKFSNKDFDLSNDYSLSTGVFTAKIAGIYHINISLKFASSVLSLTGDVGVAIQKTTLAGITATKAKASFSNIAVLGINVSPPTRTTETIVELNPGDTITFLVIGPSAITVVNEETFFSIEQVR